MFALFRERGGNLDFKDSNKRYLLICLILFIFFFVSSFLFNNWLFIVCNLIIY